MENPFDFFNEIWCINLDHRTDRWDHAQKEFEKIGIKDKVQRFSAIKHTDGRIGLIKSFYHLFEYAKAKKLQNILIFEDDVKFINNTVKNLKLALEQSENIEWKMLYFGANTHTRLEKINTNIFLLKNAFSAHAIAYHHSIFDDIINRFRVTNEIRNQNDINDVFFSSLQNKYTCLLVNPIIATQIPSYSDLEKRDVDYSFIEERFNINVEFVKNEKIGRNDKCICGSEKKYKQCCGKGVS